MAKNKIRPFRPMLAVNAPDIQDLRYPVMVSPKLDGVRCLIRNNEPVTRSLDPVVNRFVHQALSRPELEGLDGELILGSPTSPTVFRDSSAAVRREEGEPHMTYYVFDHVTDGPPLKSVDDFQNRFWFAGTIVDAMRSKLLNVDLVLVPHLMVQTPAELSKLEEQWVSEGYEGLMVRDPSGPYKFGRSTANEGWLLKVKRFVDTEGVVIGTTELMRNNNPKETNRLGLSERAGLAEHLVPGGVLGALMVRSAAFPETFEIGTGFLAEERQDLWNRRELLIGQTVTFKYQAVGVLDRPRFPVYKGFRSLADMDRGGEE